MIDARSRAKGWTMTERLPERMTEAAEMLERFEGEWERARGVLEAREADEVLHGGAASGHADEASEEHGWTVGATYAHLARWMERGREQSRRSVAGEELLPPFDEASMSEQNEQWLAEDVQRGLEQAREWAEAAHAAWLADLRALPPERWTDTVRSNLDGNGFGHFTEHIEYAIEGVVDQADAWWARYTDIVDAAAGHELHAPGGGWMSAADYAHHARWMGQSRAALERRLRGEPPPADQEHEDVLNARWQAEDATLTLEAAKGRATEARAALLGRLREVPAEAWDGVVMRIAYDDPVWHLRTHLRWLIEGVEAQADDRWQRLTAALDAHPGEVLHHDGEPWTAVEVYGHLGHWIDAAIAVAEAGADGPAVAKQYPWREVNDRWAAEDRAMDLDTVRRRTVASREQLLTMLRDRPVEAWTGFGLAWARGNLAGHLDEHLGFLEAGRDE
ncbi:MAG: hypothetical protein GEU80_05430 [Dehalococcoidia bacterium]|nr:hypothetical protein [Dehalococcoidia bacterium]